MGNLVSAHFTHGIGSGTWNILDTSTIVCFCLSTAHDLKLWDLVFNFSYNFYLCWYWVYERLNTASHLSSQICKISSLVLKLILCKLCHFSKLHLFHCSSWLYQNLAIRVQAVKRALGRWWRLLSLWWLWLWTIGWYTYQRWRSDQFIPPNYNVR